MKRILAGALLLLALAACGIEDTTEIEVPESSSSQAESSVKPVEEPAEEHVDLSGYALLPPEAYDEFSENLEGEQQPSIGELAEYVKFNLRAQEYESLVDDREIELWSFERPNEPDVFGKTQLVALVFPDNGDGPATYYGVDRTNGHLFRWQDGNIHNAERLDNVEVFGSKRIALKYIKQRFWEPIEFAVDFQLELSEDEDFPAYVSQLVEWQDKQYTYVINIEEDERGRFIVHCFENVRENEEFGHTATTNWYYVSKNGYISDFSGNCYLALPSDPVTREFYRYTVKDAAWSENVGMFPADWLAAAEAAVIGEREVERASFSRGWSYDFDGDGEREAILLLATPPSAMDWFDGGQHFVYVNAAGEAAYLMSGVDEMSDTNDSVRPKMDCQLLHYDGFDHIVLRSGNQTAAGGTCHRIYEVRDSEIQELFSPIYLNLDNDVFLESGGPQGIGPAFHFWDCFYERYSSIAPVEMPAEEFISLFDPAKAKLSQEEQELLQDRGIVLAPLPHEQIEKVDVYGGRYYLLHFAEGLENPSADCMTLQYHSDGSWSLYGPLGYLGSLHAGFPDERRKVYDVDMNQAEQTARSPNG